MGPGKRLARRYLHRQARGIRSLLPAQLEPDVRPANHHHDFASPFPQQERLLISTPVVTCGAAGTHECETTSPNRASNSRRPRLVTLRDLLSRSCSTHFPFSATFRRAAPSAPPRCGRRSLQSTHAYAKRRRSLRVASTSIPIASNAFAPIKVIPHAFPAPEELPDSQPRAVKRS